MTIRHLNVIEIKIFDIDHVNKKAVRMIFYVDFFYPLHLYTNMIISNEYINGANLYEHLTKHTSG